MSRTKHYSDYLTSWGSLVGIPATRITTELASVANTLFNTAIKQMWSQGPWLDVCPYGEARFAGNKLTYPNDLSKTASWTATAVTVTANSIANPADGLVTASKVLETSATNFHKVIQALPSLFTSTSYTVSFYARANGRGFVVLRVLLPTDSATTTLEAAFNIVTGATVTQSSAFTTFSTTQQPNGFWLCSATFTTGSDPINDPSVQIYLSTSGTASSYVGNTTKGIYVWGVLLQQTTNTTINDSQVAWEQTGENVIDVVFDVYKNSPFLTVTPTRQTYSLTPNGIQLIGGGTTQGYTNGVLTVGTFPVTNNPVFLYYRKSLPNFTGTAYSATATYAVDAQIYFTNSLGNGDYYKCLVATSAGQSPDTTAASWEIIPIYEVFFQYCVYQAYGDWLISDGAMDKATGAYAIATTKMDTEFDKRERQMGDVLPMRVATHLTSRSP